MGLCEKLDDVLLGKMMEVLDRCGLAKNPDEVEVPFAFPPNEIAEEF